ncbi:MAG: hypothetical protein DCC71_18015 [Proteobacteria bacterium]|nr:MAG: hypothetical protein DCC71_18015 [Pseudomonadota bacterium]
MTPWTHALAAVAALLLVAVPARAQERGVLQGAVTDASDGAPLAGVRVRVSGPEESDDAARATRSDTTDAKGIFSFGGLPAGTWSAEIAKDGFRAAEKAGVAVRAGQVNRADVALEPVVVAQAAPAPAESGEAEAGAASGPAPSPDVEEFLVVAPPAEAILQASRMEADALINTLSAEELSKFAAGDVADALKFVPGVNVVEGQFAIIRGLEDRYSSTLYNSAPVPSPDPDSQSVQLDLFPSDVVRDLVVAKTFAPELPGNSSGGSIDIVTQDYPEQFEIKIAAGTGWEQNARDRFLRYDDGSPAGYETDFGDILERDFSVSIGGPWEVADRGVRFKANFAREIDFRTAQGFQESREPRPQLTTRPRPPRPPVITQGGDLSLGELNLSGGRYDFTQSERTQQTSAYGGLGFDLDEAGDHRVDGSVFWTKKLEETVQGKEDGFLPNFDYAQLLARQRAGEEILPQDFNGFATIGTWLRDVRPGPNDFASRGPLWYSSFNESKSFDNDRDLRVHQINGDHRFDAIDALEGLHVRWAWNRAKTTQSEVAAGVQYFLEPDDPSAIPSSLPGTLAGQGPGRFAANSGILFSSNEIEETQDFGRVDADYERELADFVTVKLNGGGWFEKSERDVFSNFLESPTVGGNSQFALFGETPQQLGGGLFDGLDQSGFGGPSGIRETTSTAERKIRAWNVGGKATFLERVDLMGGVRRESVLLASRSDPFTGQPRFGAPATFPETYLFFDRLDNPYRGEVSRAPLPGTAFNDELLGIDVPKGPCRDLDGNVPNPSLECVDLLDEGAISSLVDGEIDEKKYLPSAAFAIRPIEGLSIRGAWSRTIARPSFRELGFYVTVEPGSDDLVVGNPQLQLSEVASWDGRVEYTWGELGDLVAVSAFKKRIADPIESIVIRNPLNFEQSSSALYRTFFNNPNEATLWGLELEARKALDFFGVDLLRYLSIGGNFTYIQAEVDRTEAELARSTAFFGLAPGARDRFEGMERSRRLFNQPEWIANADVTFDHPDWGTRVSLIYFAISNVLDAAGSAFIGPDGRAQDYTLDRYVDSYHQLDLVVTQRIWEGLTAKLSVKNLTNSTRQIVYDPYQTHREISERSFQVGRDYSFSLSYTFEF